eukprot:Nitzschia sp. Nitz4//scaffold32_size149145//17555//18436//NITZ4_002865-RA/size149145-processed-gene-0.83-mRNA-1//1//CDS//3329548027//518//frame0
MSNEEAQKSVQAGICSENGFGSCVLSSTSCSDDVSFLSSRQLQTSSTAHGGYCLLRSYVDAISTGYCQDDNICTGHSSGCTDSSQFVASYDSCRLSAENAEDGQEVAVFGRCDNTCYWSSTDCSNGAGAWYPAVDSSDCTCDKVLVGACEKDGYYFCGVDENACDSLQTWISATDLRAISGAPDCRLCREEQTDSGVEGGTSVVVGAGFGGEKDMGTGKIIGVAIGGIVAVLLLTLLIIKVGRYIQSRRAEYMGETKNSSAPPVKDISMPSTAAADEENSSTEDEKEWCPSAF